MSTINKLLVQKPLIKPVMGKGTRPPYTQHGNAVEAFIANEYFGYSGGGTTNNLLANDITCTPSLAQGVLHQTNILLANDISSTVVLGQGTIHIVSNLLANDISAQSTVQVGTFHQRHALLANDIASSAVLGQGVFKTIHALLANDISSTASLEQGTFNLVCNLTANDVTIQATLDEGVLKTIHALLADDIESTAYLSVPALTEVVPSGNDFGYILIAETWHKITEISILSENVWYNVESGQVCIGQTWEGFKE